MCVVAHFEDGKTVRSDGNDGDGFVVKEKPETCAAREFVGDLHDAKHPSEASACADGVDGLEVHRSEDVSQSGFWAFVVRDSFFFVEREFSVFFA